MMRRNFLHDSPLLVTLLAALLGTGAAAAAENPSVSGAVNQFMRSHTAKLLQQLGVDSRIEYAIAMADAQLEQSTCAIPLTLTAKDAGQLSARMSVQVNCGDSWSIYVPIDLAIFRQVVTAARPLAPGSTLDSADVQLTETDITRVVGDYLTSLDDVIGMSVKRAIPQGRAVQSQQLVPPLMVRRGEAVVINAESSSIAVKTPGIALSDGRRGEQIRIKNQGSARVISARVTGPGQVQAPM